MQTNLNKGKLEHTIAQILKAWVLSGRSTMELSAARPELERLQAENARRQEDRPEQAAEIDRAAEAERLKELYAQAL